MSHAVEDALAVLESGGFVRLPVPLIVSGAAFEFDGAVTGVGVSQDLVVIATTNSERRLVRLVSALARTLDSIGSRRPLTLLLVGGAMAPGALSSLERHARVLTISSPKPNEEEIRRAIAVLLPLELPAQDARGRDPMDELRQSLGSEVSAEHSALLEAATAGPESVREAFRRMIDGHAGADGPGGPTP